MTIKERCEVMMLAYIFIDSSKQEGLDIFKETLNSLEITFEDFKDFLKTISHCENARFVVYNDISNVSEEDKGVVRNIIGKAYSKGGKQGTDYALFYFKEIITQCDLVNACIDIFNDN